MQLNCQIYIDGHVHVHDAFDLPVLLSAAQRNFEFAAQSGAHQDNDRFVLLLCDDHDYPAFRYLVRAAESGELPGGWSLRLQAEPGVIAAERGGAVRLYIVAGRQVRTLDGLELLAVCTQADHPDGISIDDSIDRVLDGRGIGVLPWGFMKWRGRRGRTLARLITERGRDGLLLGDNSGRWALMPEPGQFAAGRRVGMQILAGTDPLPFPAQQTCVGAYGSRSNGPFDDAAVGASIRRLLRTPNTLTTYGRRERLLPFLVNQSRMQLRKRLGPTRYLPA